MFVFPMAGLSSRFSQAGYDRPKFMLNAGGRSLFWHAVVGFRRYFQTHDFLFVMREEAGTPAFVKSECARMGIARPRFVILDAPTSGQAETVALGLREAQVNRNGPLTIFNIDTVRRHFKFPASLDLDYVEGYLEVFGAPGDHWSFVRPLSPDPVEDRAAEVAEKVRISDLCSTGLYHFRTAQLFLDAYASSLSQAASDLQGGERYVAPLYNRLIAQGGDVRFHRIANDEIGFSGTPDEYDAFRATLAPRPTTAAVVTGRLRDIGDAFATFRGALALRDEGLIDTIVLSTWQGEIDGFPGLRRQLQSAGIAIVESDCPPREIRPQAMWNAWLQAAAVRRGIDATGEADCILKLRTDKCAAIIEDFRPALQDRPAPAGPLSPLHGVVAARLARVAIPLHINDIAYFGLRIDIERMAATVTDGRLQYDSRNGWTGVETRWAAGPWFEDVPLYRSFHAGVDAFAAARALMSWADGGGRQSLPQGLARVLALGWRALSDGFLLAGAGPEQEKDLSALTVEGLLSNADNAAARSTPTRRGTTRQFRSQYWIDAIAAGRFAGSPAGAVLHDALRDLEHGGAMTPLASAEFAGIARFLAEMGEDAALAAPHLRQTPAAGATAGADTFSEATAFALLCRRFGAPATHERLVRRIVERTRPRVPGARSHAVAVAYRDGTAGLPQDRLMATEWMWIGAELRHAPSVEGFAALALDQSAERPDLLPRAREQLRLAGLEGSEVGRKVRES